MNQPQILLPNSYSDTELNDFISKVKVWRKLLLYDDQVEELLEVRYPNKVLRQAEKTDFLKKYNPQNSAWVYLPWSGYLINCVGQEELYELRTNRNKNLINQDEQDKLKSSVIGVAGMSVGAGIAVGSAYSGIGKTIKLADFDKLETANLNRVREGLPSVGSNKAELAAYRLYELDPFIHAITFTEGLNTNNIDRFFLKPDLDLVVDEIDDFKMKVLLRMRAKEHKVPLLMFTSLGDNILIDIERYDIDPKQEIFNGAIGNAADEILANKDMSEEDIKRYAVQIVGVDYVPTRALESLLHIGSSLVGRPQLYSTIAVDGGLAAYIIRQILLSGKVKSGRYFIKFADLIKLDTNDFKDQVKRETTLKKLMGGQK